MVWNKDINWIHKQSSLNVFSRFSPIVCQNLLFHLNYLTTYDKHSPFFFKSHWMQFLTPFAHFPRLTFEKSLNEKLRKAINQFAQLLFCGLNCLLFMSHEKLSLEIFLSLCDRNQWTNIVNWQTFVKHFCISHFDISKISKHFIWISNDSFNCRKSCAKPNALIFYFNFSSMWLMFSTFFLPISLPQSFIVCCRRTCEMLKLFCEICWKNVESFICEWKKEK